MTEAKPTDRQAWIRAALDEHGAALLRYAAHITGDADAARDVVQDTFLRLLRQGPSADASPAAGGERDVRRTSANEGPRCPISADAGAGTAPPGDAASLNGHTAAWLFTVCRNRALDMRRKESRMIAVSTSAGSMATPLELKPACEPPPSAAMEREESTGSVLAQLARLPDSQQEVVRLRFHGGLTYRQIAEVTGLTVTNVGFLLHTALKTLRARLSEAEGGAA